MLEGAYGFCVMFKDHPGEIYCMRNASPLVASHTEDGSFIASDMVALLKYTNGKVQKRPLISLRLWQDTETIA